MRLFLAIIALFISTTSYASDRDVEDIRTMEANNSNPVVRIKREWHEVIDPKSPEGIRLIAKPKSVFVPLPVKPTLNKPAPPKKIRVVPEPRPNKPAPRINTKVAPAKKIQQKPPSGCSAMVADFRARKAKKQLSALQSFELAQKIGSSCPTVGASLFQ